MIFGQSEGEPWYGKNAGLVQGLPTGFRHVELTGGYFLSVPRPIVTQIARRTTLDLVDKPQGTAAAMTKRNVLAPTTLPLPALISPQPIEGIGITDGNFHGPAVAILGEDVMGASR